MLLVDATAIRQSLAPQACSCSSGTVPVEAESPTEDMGDSQQETAHVEGCARESVAARSVRPTTGQSQPRGLFHPVSVPDTSLLGNIYMLDFKTLRTHVE